MSQEFQLKRKKISAADEAWRFELHKWENNAVPRQLQKTICMALASCILSCVFYYVAMETPGSVSSITQKPPKLQVGEFLMVNNCFCQSQFFRLKLKIVYFQM